MGKEEQFEVLKLKTHVLKVNVHCDGCKIEVKKLLHRIQGVFSVEVDVEKQKVTVQANVDSSTLIEKLKRAGKHAEAWPVKPSNQPAKNSSSNKQQNPGSNKKSKQQSKVQHKPLPSYSSDDEDSDGDMRMLDKIRSITERKGSVMPQLLTKFTALLGSYSRTWETGAVVDLHVLSTNEVSTGC